MVLNKLLRACLVSPLLMPGMASALVVEIQGVRLEPSEVGASCVDISGVYPGVRIEADKPGQTPRICHNAGRVNSVGIANATLVATAPAKKDIVIKFEHEFPPGVNGKIMARAKLQGFFATENGVGVPAGDKVNLKAFFSQGRTSDVIGDPLDFTVKDSMESALFEYSVKKPYLAAGPRALRGELKINFTGLGHKLTFPEKCLIALDSGATFEDKLDTMEALEGEGASDAGGESGAAAPATPGAEVAKPPAPEASGEPPAAKLPPLPPLPPLGPIR